MSKTLLLADDSLTIQRVVDLTFAQEDVRVVSFANGDMAVKWMEGEMPDIVLADVGMPQPDGYALAQHMKRSSRLRDVPVLLLTGAFEPLDDDKARQSACDGVLVKPFEPQHLVSRVAELLARQRQTATERPVEATPASASTSASALAFAPEPELEAEIGQDNYQHQPDDPQPPAASSELSERASLHLVEPAAPPAAHDSFDLESFSTDLAELDTALELVDSAPAQESVDPPLELQWSAPVVTESDAPIESPDETVLEPLASLSPLSSESWDLAAPFKPAPFEPALEPSHEPSFEAPAHPTLAAESYETRAFEVAVSVPPQAPAPQLMPPVSLASAFAALLAAEQAHPGPLNASPGTGMTEAAIEDIVRRVLQRVTDEMVRQVVLDAAERMVKAEIEKIKDTPEDPD
jgi:CheY-like chemotaxis protein